MTLKKSKKNKLYSKKYEFMVADVDGFNLWVHSPEEILQSYWANGMYYEPEMIKFIQDNYKGGTFIDVGSCIGNHSIAFSRIADHVHSFEPFIITYFHQLVNLAFNNITNVYSYNVALGDKIESAKMIFDNRSAGGGKIESDGKYVIPIMKMDDYDIKDVKLIKIDVEGYELKVLKGGSNTIKTFKPDLFIECSTPEDLKVIEDYLKPFGYTKFSRSFNHTPTYLFTIKDFGEFK